METTVITPKFRVSYPSVIEARENKLSGKEEYSLTALFPKGTDLSALEKAVKAAAQKKWGADPKKYPKNLRLPFRKQEEKAKVDDETGETSMPDGHEAGAIFINLKSPKKPGLIGPSKKKIEDETEFYAGCWARAQVNAYAYEVRGNAGISFGLQNVQKVGEGEPLSGRMRAEDAFTAVEEVDESESASSLFN